MSKNKLNDKTQDGEEKQVNEYSLVLKLFSCALYGTASAALTFVNKSIYEKFQF